MNIKISPVIDKGHERWKVDFRPAGSKRQRRFFKTKFEAETFAREKRTFSQRAGETFLGLSTQERMDLIFGYERARRHGKSINQIMDEWEAGISRRETLAKVIGEAGKEWLAQLEKDKKSTRHVTMCRSFFNRFANGSSDKPVTSITLKQCQEWLGQFDNNDTFNAYRNLANGFLNYCADHKYIPENPMGKGKIAKKETHKEKIETVTNEQATQILRWVWQNDKRLLMHFALGLFTGIRPEACDRLVPEFFELDRDLIRLPARHNGSWITKTKRSRQIHLEPVAKAWIEFALKHGCTFGNKTDARLSWMKPLRAVMGWKVWPKDNLRHTFGSNYTELYRNINQTACEMGNSPDIVQKHYLDLIRPEHCKAYWQLFPETVLKGLI